jgi:penicillin-binding protein 1C
MSNVYFKWAAVIAVVIFTAALGGVLMLEDPPLDDFGAGTVLLDRHGIPLRVRLGNGEQDCRPVAGDQISPWAKRALIAAEDQRFARHPGVDPIALARAIGQNLWNRKRISGASTISTQVIRLAEPRPRTLRTKLLEAGKALRMEWHLSKDEVLVQHINRAPFGGNLTGIESAARLYFDKSAADLTLAEAALLMGVPQSPARLRPDRRPEAARERMLYVLERMQRDGYITAAQRSVAERQPLDAQRGRRPFSAPHFCDLVLQRHRQSGTLQTTLDVDVQQAVERIVARHRPGLQQQAVHGTAVVVLDVRTGGVRALLGSPDYEDRQHAGMVNAATALRSPGSALKPFIYAMALEQGMITPGSRLDDRPLVYRDIRPENFDGTFQGEISAREALILSLNMPVMRLTEQAGVQAVVDTLRALGFTTLTRPADHYGVGIALGSAEVQLLELANAYACLAREGRYLPYRLIEPRAPADGGSGQHRPTLSNPPFVTQREDEAVTSQRPDTRVADANARIVFSPETAYMVADMLGGRERSMAIFGHVADAQLPRIAWKTGTSSGFRDAWTVAWNPDYVVGVWVGNPDGSPTPELTGADIAAPIAGDIFRALCAPHVQHWFAKPQGLDERIRADGTREWYVPGISRPTPTPPPPPDHQALTIIEPADGTVYRLLAHSPHDQAIALRGRSAINQPLHWFANGRYIGATAADTPLHWTLEKGNWTIACSAPDGTRDTIALTVQ